MGRKLTGLIWVIAGTAEALGNCRALHPLPLSHDPGRHSLSALFALLRGSPEFNCTPPWLGKETSVLSVWFLRTSRSAARDTLLTHGLVLSLAPYLLF